MGKGTLRPRWAAAALFLGLLVSQHGVSAAANPPRVIAASGTTVVDHVIPSLLANATQQLAPTQGNLTLTFESVERRILEIPWAVANTAMVYNLPGTPKDALRLNPKVLAGIYACNITSWQDPAIAALNPNLSLPNLKIIPASYSESKGTTKVMSRYLELEPSWTLGSGVQLPWPRCVQHVRTPDGIAAAVARAPGALSWVADWRVNETAPAQLYTAHLQNAAGNFIPSNATYTVDSIPVPPIISPAWENVTFATSTQADIYPMGGFVFNMVGQDISASGPDQASAMQALMGYFLSNTVQQNLGSWTLLPLPKALLAAGRQAVSSMIARPSNQNQTRGGYAIAPASFSNPVGGGDGLVSGAVVEGAGGASIQNLVKSVLANASATGRFGNAGLTFAPTDSDQGKQGVVSQNFAYAMSTLPLTQDDLTSAKRPMVQVPVGYSPLAVVHSIPGIGNGELMLNAAVLSAIFQCQVQNWNDASIASLNPNITLPNQPINPLGLSDNSGTTAQFATYLARSPNWKLGVQTSVAWPRCVRRTIGGSNGMISSTNGTVYTVGYAALASFIMVKDHVSVASIANKGNVFVSPYNSVFPFHLDELPPSISSTNWTNLDLSATVVHYDRYPIGGLIYILTSQDLSILGYPQSVTTQQLILYWLSNAVQSNFTSMGASPLLPSYLAIAQQQVAALNTDPMAPGQAPSPGMAAAGSANSAPAPQQRGSSGAGFPWWAGLIIALVALAVIGVLAGLAALFWVRRRRARRASALEEAIQKQDAPLAEKGAIAGGAAGGLASDEHPGSSGPGSQGSRGAGQLSSNSSHQSAGYRGPPGNHSNRFLAMDAEHGGGPDDRMPLNAEGLSTRSAQSSGSTQQGSLNGAQRGDRRRSSSYGRDWAHDASTSSWGGGSRGQSLNNEAAFSSLPDILKSRAESVDIDDIERGSLLGRGSFGKVYQGWWRGGMVAIKVVPHEGDLGEKVEIVRESLLSSSIQHPQIVTTYKAITVGHGAHQSMRREEAIPEGSAYPSRGSARGSGGRGSGSSNTNKSSAARDDMMETWIIMEYCDLGSLDNAISDGRFEDLEHLLLRLLDVAMGMDYLHKLGILHTDLKPSNVLLKTAPKQANDPTGCTCKLADFGLSRVMETNATHISTNTIGTIAYQPEEVLKEGKVTPASDVYSFAILMYELYTCKHLFKGMMHSQMFFKVFNGYRPPLPESMPRGMQDLMKACWSHNPAERPSFRFITRALQKLIIEQRRARATGRQASMNLDDALAGAEMAKQYPVAPAMPIQQPSDPARQHSDSSRGASLVETPQSSGQKVVSMSEFELALLDFRKKASAGQVGSQPEQQQHRQEGGSCDGHQEADVSEHQGLSGDGPETPPKLHSAGSPPPARSSTAGGAGAAEGSAGPPGQSPPASSAAAQGAAGGPQGVSPAAAGGPAAAEGAAQHAAPKPSAFAAHSLSPTSADDWSPATQHVPLPPRTSRANRYDLLLGD